MTIPLDPVIAEIIPLLPLRDPATMRSARSRRRAPPFRRRRSRAWTTAA